MQNNSNGASPRLDGKSATALFPSDTESKWVDKEMELEAKLEEIRKLCPQKCNHCDEMLSLLRAHFASHREDEGATEGAETDALSEEAKQVPATPVDLPPPKKVLRSRHDKTTAPSWSKVLDSTAPLGPSAVAEIRTTRSATTEATPAAMITTDHKKSKQPVINNEVNDGKPPSIPVKPGAKSSSTLPLTRSDSPPVKKKAVLKSKPSLCGPVPIVESLGKDVPSQVREHFRFHP